ncbi:general transcription and DNA repair factor IIH helicase subunit XPB [Apis mellifera carnica]|nr:general transcription and DNA repair factor IIH helicase subunit XPB [Apis mellifera carnica]
MGPPKRFKKDNDRGKWKKRKEDPEEYNEDDTLDDNETEGIPDAAKNDVEKQDDTALEDEFGAKDYRSQMILKPDCALRPLWVAPNGHIFLESFSPVYKHAHDFLIAISEPVCRPEHIHEYKLTAYSLYACLKLVLKHNKYFVESPYPEVLQKLLKDPVIQECRLKKNVEDDKDEIITNVQNKTKTPQFGAKAITNVPTGTTKVTEPTNDQVPAETAAVPEDITTFYDKIDKEDEDEEEEHELKTVSFEVNQEKIEVIQKRCIELEYPLLAEYDFRNDTINPDINIDLETISCTETLSGEKFKKNVWKWTS